MEQSAEKPCKLEMVEIYSGNDPKWKGWHNLILVLEDGETSKAIAGPLDPTTSLQIIEAIILGGIDGI